MKLQPNVCRPEAFQLLAEQLPNIETTDGLLKATIAISLHALDDVDPQDCDDYFLALAARVIGRTRSGNVQAILAHLHQVLFVEEGFEGNQIDFYNPLNSYLPAVIAGRWCTKSWPTASGYTSKA